MPQGSFLQALLSRFYGCGGHDFYQLYLENEGRIGWDDDLTGRRILKVFPSIAKAWRDGEVAFTPFFHTVYAYLEAWNEPWITEHEGERLVAMRCGTVKNGAISKFANIEDGNGVARLCFRARAHFHILSLYLICLGSSRRGSLRIRRGSWRTNGFIDKINANDCNNNDDYPYGK